MPDRRRGVVRRGGARCSIAAQSRRRGDAACPVGPRHQPTGPGDPPSGSRRRVLANSVGRPQHRLGTAPQWTARGAARRWHVVRPLVGTAGRTCAGHRCGPACRHLAESRGDPGRAAAGTAGLDTCAGAGRLAVTLDEATTRMLLGRSPAAFHAGVQDILLIAFGLAWRSSPAPGPAACRSASTSKVTGAPRIWHPTSTCPAPSAGSPPNTPWPCPRGGCPGRTVAGGAALGPVIKAAKEQLRALPDGADLRPVALPESRCGPGRSRPDRRLQLPRAAGCRCGRPVPRPVADQPGQLVDVRRGIGGPDGVGPPAWNSSAGTLDGPADPQLQANWMWAPSVLSREQVGLGSAGCGSRPWPASVRTCSPAAAASPSDVAPVQLTQKQIDQLTERYRIADVLPLTPLQKGLLFSPA